MNIIFTKRLVLPTFFLFYVQKLSCILVFIFFVSVYSNAQSFIGLSTGLNVSTIRYDNDSIETLMNDSKHFKAGFYTSAIYEIALNKAMHLQSNLFFSQKGFSFKQNRISGKNKLNYLGLNICGKLVFKVKKNIYVDAMLGPYSSFWISGKYIREDSYTGEKSTTRISFSGNDKFNRWDAGIVFQTNLLYQADENIIFTGISYEHGFISNDLKGVDGSKNRTLFFRFGILHEIDF